MLFVTPYIDYNSNLYLHTNSANTITKNIKIRYKIKKVLT